MKVTIQDVNYKRALYIFTSDDVEINYGVFELLDFEDFEKEEELIGDFRHLGETTVTRKLDGKKYKIFMEDYGCSLSKARQIIADKK